MAPSWVSHSELDTVTTSSPVSSSSSSSASMSSPNRASLRASSTSFLILSNSSGPAVELGDVRHPREKCMHEASFIIFHVLWLTLVVFLTFCYLIVFFINSHIALSGRKKLMTVRLTNHESCKNFSSRNDKNNWGLRPSSSQWELFSYIIQQLFQ